MTDQGAEEAQRPARDRLVEEMRRIKEASGLSFGKLAARTNYSSSSWERFLNGKQPPSRIAVEELAAAGGQAPERLLALWEEAAAQDSEATSTTDPEATPTTDPEAETAAGPPHTVTFLRRVARHLAAVGYIAVGALLGSLFTVLLTTTQRGAAEGKEPTPATQSSATVDPIARETKPGCRSDTCLSREPQAMDCQWDATTVRQTWLRGLQIQLRYSPSCQAVWGRIENGTVGDEVTITDRWGRTDDARIRVGTDTYTRMLAVSPGAPATTVTICGLIPSQRDRECSPTAPPQT
ncbi:helix-turn-helix domain-containing protein [Streptomyces sp. NPDC055966]|uniref:helix-turn-helix domain-containing protein n=1 Tax=unclassified Streptomyces TaxID=2593676 RepID=UPI0035DDD50F